MWSDCVIGALSLAMCFNDAAYRAWFMIAPTKAHRGNRYRHVIHHRSVWLRILHRLRMFVGISWSCYLRLGFVVA